MWPKWPRYGEVPVDMNESGREGNTERDKERERERATKREREREKETRLKYVLRTKGDADTKELCIINSLHKRQLSQRSKDGSGMFDRIHSADMTEI